MDWRAFILGVIIGWLIELAIDWFFWRPRDADVIALPEHERILATSRAEISLLKAENGRLQSRLASMQIDADRLTAAELEVKRLSAELAATHQVPDDLKRVAGIGPKIEHILKVAGITTFAKLADSSPSRLRDILVAAGERYRLADPASWPQQAALAKSGNWDELSYLQAGLEGGLRRRNGGSTPT